MTPIPKRLVGAEQGTRGGRAGDQGTRCPPRARAAPRAAEHLERRAGSRPPLPQGSPGRRGTQWAREPRARLGRLRKGKEKRGAGGGGGGPEIPPRAGPGARHGAEERGFPTGDPTKTRGDPQPSPAGRDGREGRRRWQVRSSERPPSWRGVPGPPHAGRSPLPAAARAPGPALAPEVAAALGSPGRPGRAGTRQRESWFRVCFVLPGWRRARPRGRTSGGASGVPRPRSGRPGAAPRCARRVPPRARPGLSRSASPSSARPLPEPGLIWSRWRQGVGAAQPPLLGCQYPAHSPARSLARSHAHPRAAAAARPGILSKFPAQPARARRCGARGRRGVAARAPSLRPAPSPPPHLFQGEKNNAARSDFPPPASFSPGGADLVHYLRGKFCGQCLFSEMFINVAAAPTEPCYKRGAHF